MKTKFKIHKGVPLLTIFFTSFSPGSATFQAEIALSEFRYLHHCPLYSVQAITNSVKVLCDLIYSSDIKSSQTFITYKEQSCIPLSHRVIFWNVNTLTKAVFLKIFYSYMVHLNTFAPILSVFILWSTFL